jgi:hypothetical protein
MLRILLDEDVPQCLVDSLRSVLSEHEVTSLHDLGWEGKTDIALFRDAAKRGYAVLFTCNVGQLNDDKERAALVRSKLHHVLVPQHPRMGSRGPARTTAEVLLVVRGIVEEIARSSEQLLFEVPSLNSVAPARVAQARQAHRRASRPRK